MPRVRGPLQSDSVSGQFGNSFEFQTRHGKTYARVRTKPANPRTERQQHVRAIHRILLDEWSALPAPVVNAWRTFANLNQKLRTTPLSVRTAQNWYTACNFFLHDWSGESRLDIPWGDNPYTLGALTTNWDHENEQLTISWEVAQSAIGLDHVDVWLAGPMAAPGQNARAVDYRHKTYAWRSPPVVILPGLQKGTTYYVKARSIQEDGRTGRFTPTYCIQTVAAGP